MEESMATTPVLPMKRPYEEVASDSDSCPDIASGSDSDSDSDSDAEEEEALRRAKLLELGNDIPEFATYSEFAKYCGKRHNQFLLDRYQEQVTRRCRLQEIRYFLKSKGQADRAESIQSEEDLDEEELREFKAKQWYLKDLVGPYDDYQRLAVHHHRWGKIYHNFFHTYDCDIAYHKLFDELKEPLEQASRKSIAESIIQSVSVKYAKNLDSASLNRAIRQSFDWWFLEGYKKDTMPILSKICHEVLIKERGIEEVVNETVRQVVGPCTRGESYILADIDGGRDFVEHHINHVKRYITENREESSVDEIYIECLVKRCMEEDPHYLYYVYKYIEYIEMKLPVAKNLGII